MNYNVGDTIEYRTFADTLRVVKVVRREDINGRPGFDGDVVNTGEDVWGYDSQITRKLS